MVALVAESNTMFGFIMIMIPHLLVMVVPNVELKVVTVLKGAAQLKTKDCAVELL